MAWTEALNPVVKRPVVLGMAGAEWLQSRVLFNPTTPRYFADPYPMYRRLRERDPVHRSYVAGGWVLTRHADVAAVLRDRRFAADERHFYLFERIWRKRARLRPDPDAAYEPSLLRLDGNDHRRLRGLVSKAFTPRAVEKLRGRVETLCGRLLDTAARDEMDVIRDLATPLPVAVIAEMLGVPGHDLQRFKAWSADVVRIIGLASDEDIIRARRAELELAEYIHSLAEERRREPADDLLSALVLAEEAGDKLDMDELVKTCVLLLVAGNETTTNLIGNGVLALLRHPEELAWLREHPERAEAAVEELLRFDSPVQLTSRFATEDIEFRGRPIRRRQQVLLILGAANRDPERFGDPDRLDLRREAEGHLAFGHGAHFCLGAQLARLEASVALRELVLRFPALSLRDHSPPWRAHTLLRGLASLRVGLGA